MSKKKKAVIGIGIGLVAIAGVISVLMITGKKLHEQLDFENNEI